MPVNEAIEMMPSPRCPIALLIPDPSYGERWQPHVAQLVALLEAELPVTVTPLCWRDNPSALKGYDLILPLFAWGYQHYYGEWYALLDWLQQEQLNIHNPAALMRWNTDKHYLHMLADKGVPTIPTMWADALRSEDLTIARADFACDQLLVKPPISAGSYCTYILTVNDGIPDDVKGQRMMVQPVLDSVRHEGEYSLFYFDGVFSHALRKVPKAGDFRVQEQFGASEIQIEPDAEAKNIAALTLQAIEEIFEMGAPLYTRIDLLRDNQGRLALLELEAIEPSLFLNCASDGGVRFAAAVGARLSL